jgi:hypothetical protein
MSPWISMTFFEPASRWKPSTFCVRTQTLGTCASNAVTASWAALYRAPRHARSICPMYFHESAGFFANMAPERAVSMGMPSSVPALS